MINHLTIIGVGLIGSSLSLSLKQSGFVKRVTGCGRSEENLKKGIELGVLDDYSLSISDAIKGADVVVVAVPLGAMNSVFQQMQSSLDKSTVITDVGSAKGTVLRDAHCSLGEYFPQFVPGHPIAGSENSGVEAGFASLYHDRKIILTPEQNTNKDAVAIIDKMWRETGADVELMTVEHHDRVLAATSHLPHMLAFSLVSHLSKMSDQDEIFNYAAGGFRDFTRIAASDPVMWRDICMANGDALLELIDGFKKELDEITKAIQHQDSEGLFELFRDSKHTRDQLRDL
ncbi:MAG: prephenate dehydrogenase/arogenate dehydrogenase family protein [Gammaproteobacteria bacterium]|nr:prephenate dehydrogenase/arogenate dehydrogenase family protein [Gammaproteobacteria bacterium]MBT3724637.1 prephenate dehydrogenase/arogenate dehydrogenase family protein [Gammaproteobacteria bacterium]MBT4078085.1 prephenate dehydrogenase/arogenate dehydrogenase family protein [Gammaproteobacteria bacterium]MBT4194150.1 prephenate dehydrogenase/arogenate dehydrogenase family protein [Gammaproteobacteria bacterium]MBT4451747.1 prephenate dehydrogenase/arogenate dehydrogenase family protein 